MLTKVMVLMLTKVLMSTLSNKVMVDPNSNPNPIYNPKPILRLYKKAYYCINSCKILLKYPYCKVLPNY